MKSKFVIATALLISVAAFAQKNEIKAAEKALKSGNTAEAVTILKGAESLIANATDAEKAQYYFVQGNAFSDLAKKNIETGKNLSLAAESFQDLLAVEKTSGKDKYSSQAKSSILDIKIKLINSAIADTKNNKNVDGAKKLYEAYLLDKKDTINLYYAASTYINGKDFESAIKCYDELKVLKFSGKGENFLATNKVSGSEDLFASSRERDLAVKLGTHEKPRLEKIPSKRGEIYKNIALILVQEGKVDEAKAAIVDARKANPEDNTLLYTEANLYLQTKDYDTYKKLISEALLKNPNDADLLFNLGVISANAKNLVEAEGYYKKVIEIDPKYINAYINLSALKLSDEKDIIDEMNNIPPGKNDKRYNELKLKRENLFKSVIPYLSKAYDLDTTNIDVAKTLLNVYSALEMMPEKKALKAKIDLLEAQ
jgi:tetratricopeptide (TPR) repeat protein